MSAMKVLLLTIFAEAPLWGQHWPSPAADGEQHLILCVLHVGGDVPLKRIIA